MHPLSDHGPDNPITWQDIKLLLLICGVFTCLVVIIWLQL